MSKVLTVEQLEIVKKIAGEHGFKSNIGFNSEYAVFCVAGISDIYVRYEASGTCKRPEVTVSWTSCDGGCASVIATRGFMQQMEAAGIIAEKLKNMVDGV